VRSAESLTFMTARHHVQLGAVRDDQVSPLDPSDRKDHLRERLSSCSEIFLEPSGSTTGVRASRT